jgi:S-adenosylmethionine synthetase
MSLEAAAGKNPVSHVGKIYDVLATRLARAIVATTPEVREAHCLIVSQIGASIATLALVQVKLAVHDGAPPDQFRSKIEELVADRFGCISTLSDELIAGSVGVF